MTETTNKPPVWFWIISGLALLWNLGGVSGFFMQVTMTPEVMAELSDAQRAMMVALPKWMTLAFGVAVFGGVLGCIMLLLRKSIAIWFFIISLIAVLAQQCYWWILSDVGKSLGGFDLAMTIMIPIIAVFLIWFARKKTAKGWLV